MQGLEQASEAENAVASVPVPIKDKVGDEKPLSYSSHPRYGGNKLFQVNGDAPTFPALQARL